MKAFEQWREENPDLVQAFITKALAMKRSGRPRYSARGIIHVLRWDTHIKDKDATFNINNNQAADLSRWAMESEPELAGFFETRCSPGQRHLTIISEQPGLELRP